MIEKLGHNKRVQIMRREWIDEDKLTRRDDSPPTITATAQTTTTTNSNDQSDERREGDDVPDDNNELDDLLAELERPVPSNAT
jgi:replication fork protection complex subunit Csm3/Swi3